MHHQLAEAFASAPLEAGGWERALRLFAESTGSQYGQLIGITGPASVPFNWAPDVPPKALDDFVEIEGGSAERSFRVAASAGAMELVHEDHYAEARKRLIDDVYLDFCRDNDIPFGMQTVLHQRGEQFVGLAMLRGKADGISTADQRALFTSVAPLVLSAFRTNLALEGQGTLLLAGALESMSVAACLLDGYARVSAITPRAEALATGDPRLRLSEGRLACPDADTQTRFDRTVMAVLAGSPAMTIALRDPAGFEPPLLATISRLGNHGHWSIGALPRVLVTLRGARPGGIDAELLAQAFGLTSGEARVAAGLATGLSREEIAAQRGASPATVRTQIKSIFGKVGVNREVALVARIRDLLQP